MKENQKILYDNFKKESETNKDPIIRKKCEKAAAEILKSFPDFEIKVQPKKEVKPKSKPEPKEK